MEGLEKGAQRLAHYAPKFAATQEGNAAASRAKRRPPARAGIARRWARGTPLATNANISARTAGFRPPALGKSRVELGDDPRVHGVDLGLALRGA
jgi:hypothetical protein